jgi:DNA repair protein RecN (Recombination protein N)
LVFELQNKAENIDVNQALLDELNSKVNKINALFLKHSVKTVEELVEIQNQLEQEQSNFSDLENFIAETNKKILETEKILEKKALDLSKNRKKNIPNFENKIHVLLQQMGLEKAKIAVELSESKDFNMFGKENISILFQANSGFPMKPIQTAISGGERSRVMLAVKKIIAENSELPTLVLDEIDTGVSGRVAEEMGKLMHEMGKNMQLIVISHLAQVAAKGDNNYKVVKQDVAGKTISNIIPLSKEEKLQEIAQLLSGSKITDAALQQAKELIGN